MMLKSTDVGNLDDLTELWQAYCPCIRARPERAFLQPRREPRCRRDAIIPETAVDRSVETYRVES